MYECIHAYIHTYIHTYIRTYIHTCIPTYIHTHIHTCTYMHTYIHTRTYIHRHKYTSTYTYLYAHIHSSNLYARKAAINKAVVKDGYDLDLEGNFYVLGSNVMDLPDSLLESIRI